MAYGSQQPHPPPAEKSYPAAGSAPSSQTFTLGPNQFSGEVKSYNSEKGFGFITCKAMEEDVFFLKGELPEDVREQHGKGLKGRLVAFESQSSKSGRTKAVHINFLPQGEGQRLVGEVKSFSEKHGYGFIKSASLVDDVRFEGIDLPAHVPKDDLKGKYVSFYAQRVEGGGMRARELQLGGGASSYVPTSTPMPMLEGHMPSGDQQGVIKSWSDKNGYGFINIPGRSEDIKFGRSDMAPDVAALPGEVLRFLAVSFTAQVDGVGRVQARNVSKQQGIKRSAMEASTEDDRPAKLPKMEVLPGERVHGVIRTYNAEKGWGFINSPGTQGDIYFQRMSITDGLAPAKGEQVDLKGRLVSLDLGVSPEGRLRASNVTFTT